MATAQLTDMGFLGSKLNLLVMEDFLQVLNHFFGTCFRRKIQAEKARRTKIAVK